MHQSDLRRLNTLFWRAPFFFCLLVALLCAFFCVPALHAKIRGDGPLTASQRLWLDAHTGKLTLAFEGNWPPVSFFDGEGTARGIIPDYIALIEEKLDFTFVRVRYDSWADILQASYNGEVDVVPTMVRTPERAAQLSFTLPYFQVPTVIVTGPGSPQVLSLNDMDGKRVCVLRDGASHQVLARREPGIKLVLVDSVLDGLKQVSFGEAEGLVADIATVTFLIEKHGLKQLQSAGYTHYSHEMRMGLSKANPMLLEIMDRGLSLVTSEEKQHIFKGLIYTRSKPFYREPVFRLWLLGGGGVLGIGFLSMILFWNWSLRRAVEKGRRVSHLAEESLRAQAAELEAARQRVARGNLELTQVFNASTPMLIIDRDFNLLRMNRTFRELFGVSPSNISEKRCHEVVQSAMCCTDACPLRQALAGKVPQRSEGLFSTASCEGIPCLVAANTLTDEADHVAGIVETFTDISRLLQAEEETEQLQAQLRHSQKMEAIGTLAGGIAHDFNNILSPIIGYAEMTQLSSSPNSVEAESMTGILKAAQRARNLVRQILTLSRRHQTELIPVHVQAVVQEALTLLRSTLPTTIAISQELEAEGRMVCGDPTHVHQVVMNLCTNAYHAMEGMGGGTLVVGLDRVPVNETMALPSPPSSGTCLRVVVRDTGVGMDDATRDRIFDPYFTTKGEGKGTGLGLSVVHGIVRESGGTISVISQPGVGTAFTLLLPEVVGMVPPKPVRVASVLPKGRETVLVVDDEEDVVSLLKRMLCRAGYRVTASVGSRKALRLYQATPDAFDLVLTDMTMPGMTGYELAREIKAMTPDTPVILCTGYKDRVIRDKAEKIGVCTFLMKPVSMRTLLNEVRKELDTILATGGS